MLIVELSQLLLQLSLLLVDVYEILADKLINIDLQIIGLQGVVVLYFRDKLRLRAGRPRG